MFRGRPKCTALAKVRSVCLGVLLMSFLTIEPVG